MKKIISSALLLAALFCLPQAVSAQEKKESKEETTAPQKAAKVDAPATTTLPAGEKPTGKVVEKKVKSDGQMQPATKEKPQAMRGRRLSPKPGTDVAIGKKIEKKKKEKKKKGEKKAKATVED